MKKTIQRLKKTFSIVCQNQYKKESLNKNDNEIMTEK